MYSHVEKVAHVTSGLDPNDESLCGDVLASTCMQRPSLQRAETTFDLHYRGFCAGMKNERRSPDTQKLKT